MKQLELKEIQLISLGILLEFGRFCSANNLRYSLCAGTLIGAARHNGFIPWDDDIDVMMPREDYDRFDQIYKDTSGRFELLSYNRQSYYYVPFMKLCDTHTYVEHNNHKIGVNIDIFPCDGLPGNNGLNDYVRDFIKLQDLVIKKRTIDWKSGHILTEILKYIGKSILYPGTRKSYIKKFVSKYTSHPIQTSDNAGCLAMFNHYKMKEILPSYIFKEYVDLSFEGYKFKCFKYYHEYLSSLYGNYMQLPPVEKRQSGHHFNAFLKE